MVGGHLTALILLCSGLAISVVLVSLRFKWGIHSQFFYRFLLTTHILTFLAACSLIFLERLAFDEGVVIWSFFLWIASWFPCGALALAVNRVPQAESAEKDHQKQSIELRNMTIAGAIPWVFCLAVFLACLVKGVPFTMQDFLSGRSVHLITDFNK